MDFGARTIRGSFAREIEGLELWQPLGTDTVERLRLEWKQAGVLLFRRQLRAPGDRDQLFQLKTTSRFD
jgi:alpha-ketoglutarate-dependent taurine dioxygenase